MEARYSPMKPNPLALASKSNPSTLALKSDEPTVPIPIEQQIQQRAYELYEERGRTDGHDVDHWLQAESEVTQHKAMTVAA